MEAIMQQSVFSPLYFINYWVDQIQNAKTDSVDFLINDKELQSIVKKGIEAQTKFVKQNAELFNDCLTYSKTLLKF